MHFCLLLSPSPLLPFTLSSQCVCHSFCPLSFFVTCIAFNELQRKLLQVLQGSASSARSTRKFIDCLLGDDNNVNDDDSNDDGVENATGNASATGNNLGMSTAIESRLYIKCIFFCIQLQLKMFLNKLGMCTYTYMSILVTLVTYLKHFQCRILKGNHSKCIRLFSLTFTSLSHDMSGTRTLFNAVREMCSTYKGKCRNIKLNTLFKC